MEEGGHYYTVYTVSLAVGFANHVARRHAFFSQMPDEVDQLDAANLEMTYAERLISRNATMTGLSDDGNYSREDRRLIEGIDSELRAENEWRILIERSLHALTGRRTRTERQRTRELLQQTRIDNYLRFGLLLHRFGDTYAHTQMDHPSRLYFADADFSPYPFSEGHGHARHMDHPDNPWERPRLMDQYVTALYELLIELAQRPENRMYLRNPPDHRTLTEVREIFTHAIEQAIQYSIDRDADCSMFMPKPASGICSYDENSGPQRYFIDALCHDIRWRFNILMAQYTPEHSEILTWQQFRNRYGRRDGPVEGISWRQIEDAVGQISRDTQ